MTRPSDYEHHKGGDPKMSEPLMDIGAVADRLGVTPRFVRRLVSDRRIPYYKVGHFVRFDPSGVDAWLAQQRREAA